MHSLLRSREGASLPVAFAIKRGSMALATLSAWLSPHWPLRRSTERWKRLDKAWTAIAPFFWGDRVSLDECAKRVRSFLEELDEG